LGHTVAAASAVLAAFMGGLALGAVAGGRRAGGLSRRQALRAYAFLEIGIGAYALVLPWLLRATHPVLSAIYGEAGGPLFAAARLATALLAVGLPAALMGATYPFMVKAGAIGSGGAASLYAANTAGAALGALAAGFALLPALGMSGSTLVAAGGNALIAVVAWRLWRADANRSPVTRPFEGGAAGPGDSPHSRSGHPALALPLSIAALSGFCALALEVVWTRTLAMTMGPTTYAFSAMVVCFISGMAAGSSAGAWLARGGRNSAAGVALALAAAAVAVGAGVNLVDDALLSVASIAAQRDITFAALLRHEFRWALVLITPAAFCFGAVFPLTLALARAATPGRAAVLYAANTVGAVAGALAAGLLLIPALGLRGSFLGLAGALGATCLVITAARARRAPLAAGGALILLVLGGVTLVRSDWNPALLSSGGYKYAAYTGREHLAALLEAGTLRYYEEGAAGTVAVRDLTGVRSLSIDGKVDASSGGDMLTQRLLAHVPLLLHPAARRVGIIGLGSGVTLGSALTHRLDSADVVEISPQVIEASGWFAAENRRALDDDRVRLIRGDARAHFGLSRGRKYDVIISEPSNPWMAGVAALFTREFFRALDGRMADGGLVCQWTHTYDIAEEDLRSIVGTFASVFPHVSMWRVGDGDLLLVGSRTRPVTADALAVDAPPPALQDLQASGVGRPGVLRALYAGDATVARRWADGASLQSDDRMALEFTAPQRIVGASAGDPAAALADRSALELPAADLRDAGLALLNARSPRRAWTLLASSAPHLPRDAAALDGLARAAAAAGRLEEAGQLVSSIRQKHRDSLPALIQHVKLLAARGELEPAWSAIASVDEPARMDPQFLEAAAAIAADAGDGERLADAVRELQAVAPDGSKTHYFSGVLHLVRGEAAAARFSAERALESNPRDAAAWNLLGAALAQADAPADEIRRAFERAVSSDPADPSAYVNLGAMRLQAGDLRQASDWFAQALTIDPENTTARLALARIARER